MADLRHAYEVRGRRTGPASTTYAHNLPAELTSFVGRQAELRSVAVALTGARCLTLTGPGGCGKTRLAKRTAERQVDFWRDGVWWIDLSRETDPAIVARHIASGLGVLPAPGTDATPALARQLHDRHLLLVLDNCEHLLPAVAEVVSELLRRCPHLTVLATGREPLGVLGEVVWRVPPMDAGDAVTLFAERCARGAATPAAASAVDQICARLDGIPLAIELASAWTGTLSPYEIVTELDDRFGLLIAGPRAAPPRQRTLEASMAWSHDLLEADERLLFRRLGVFQAGFTLAAAQNVCGFDGIAVLPALRRLVDKSLLVALVAETGEGVTRYRMLETVRHYALGRLTSSGELSAVQDRHLTTYLAIAEGAAPLLDTDKDAWRALIHAEYPNLRTALEWGLSLDDPHKGRRLAAALAWLWHLEGRRHEGLSLLRLAADRGSGLDEHSALQARVLTGLALVADTTHPFGDDFDAANAARDMARACGDPRTARLAGVLGAIGLFGHDLDGMRAQALDIRAEASAAGDAFAADAAGAVAGLVAHSLDEHQEAITLLETAVTGLVRRGDRGIAAMALGLMALSNAHLGRLRQAGDLAAQAVDVAHPLADYHRVGTARSVLAFVRGLQGRPAEAREALDPIVRLVDRAPAQPFIPRLALAIGQIHLGDGRPDLAIESYRREASWSGGDASDEDLALETRIALVAALRAAGDLAAAERSCSGALELARTQGMPRLIAAALEQQAFLADPDRAVLLHHEALALRAEHGLRLACLDSLDALVSLAAQRGSPLQAARLLGACDRARDDLGCPRPDHTLHTEPALGAPEYDDALAEGRLMDLDEAIAYARRARTTRRRPASGWASLTPAEREVVQLAVDGLTNPEIGKRLFMSRSTVKTHLAHVYAKLGVANRTELATSVASTVPD
ncbi:LuxR C-terminal-related transcriptional regulator [Nonomuraea sp. NPDC049158]|uniref:LuxR C-terminal-related transcriptional regulator n=1 Tax=Nonomuraea sp. NPDC049158 TaxID=3155649 RepID=UPI0034015C52